MGLRVQRRLPRGSGFGRHLKGLDLQRWCDRRDWIIEDGGRKHTLKYLVGALCEGYRGVWREKSWRLSLEGLLSHAGRGSGPHVSCNLP